MRESAWLGRGGELVSGAQRERGQSTLGKRQPRSQGLEQSPVAREAEL